MRSAYDQHIQSGDFRIIVQFGRDRAVPYFKDATRLYDVLTSEEQKKVADVVFRQTELARPFAAPPGTPKDRVAALRRALLVTLKDPGLITDAKSLEIDFDPVTGEETAEMFAGFYAMPPALVEEARRATRPE